MSGKSCNRWSVQRLHDLRDFAISRRLFSLAPTCEKSLSDSRDTQLTHLLVVRKSRRKAVTRSTARRKSWPSCWLPASSLGSGSALSASLLPLLWLLVSLSPFLSLPLSLSLSLSPPHWGIGGMADFNWAGLNFSDGVHAPPEAEILRLRLFNASWNFPATATIW